MKAGADSVLVVGAGIAGIRSALDLAELGIEVVLIDRAPHLGGVLSQLDRQFPSDHCGMCRMLPLVERDAVSQFCLRKGLHHEKISVQPATELVGLTGEPGRFQAVLRTRPSMVDSARCIGCGECSRVCPVTVPDGFNAGLKMRKAVYLPMPHIVPNGYVVDTAVCSRCGACQQVCPTGAIDLQLEVRRAFRVLVVDDELIVRDSIKEWLQDEGFSVDMAESGAEALDRLSRASYNLVFLDVKMPGMDGVEVLKRVREKTPDLPVIMMTAYATVETAVEAMKVGARDYLLKPFDVENLLNMAVDYYRSQKPATERSLDVGAVIVASGFTPHTPASARNLYGYGFLPGVVTSVELERMLSGTGPHGGRLVHPDESGPVRRMAWIQCVGSRNLAEGADYCSSACCMISLKEAMWVHEATGGAVSSTVFFMDMRTFEKDFQRYRDRAEREHGVRFIRSRVHTVSPDSGGAGRLLVAYVNQDGKPLEEPFDLVVLAVGGRPASGCDTLAEVAGIGLNPWGFLQSRPGAPGRSSREGVFLAGAATGLKGIAESITSAGSAALEAAALLKAVRGGLTLIPGGKAVSAGASPAPEADFRDVSREWPQAAVVLCTCGETLGEAVDLNTLAGRVRDVSGVSSVLTVDRLCTVEGWELAVEKLSALQANRLLFAACMPYVYIPRLKELGRTLGIPPSLMDVVDIRTPVFSGRYGRRSALLKEIESLIRMGLARLRESDPMEPVFTSVVQRALVVGGGAAGMTAALAIAGQGHDVCLLEREEKLGGAARRWGKTLEGLSAADVVAGLEERVRSHPRIQVHTDARIAQSAGSMGRFSTTFRDADGTAHVVEHGVTLVATGACEAETASYLHGKSPAVITQSELGERLRTGGFNPADVHSVVMIQCVDSREEPRNYCSRICCAAALQNALTLREADPDLYVTVFYRDMMSYGFLESAYTRARQAGVLFIPYDKGAGPRVSPGNDGRVLIEGRDPILGRNVLVEADLLVLSTGLVPGAATEAAAIAFGLQTDDFGFLREADSKWRPVESSRPGVFVCGTALGPRSLVESIASAQAAAVRALRIIKRSQLAGGRVSAAVRTSLCSLCERCLAVCPFGARRLDEEEERIVVDELVCQGCGACAAACPNGASILRGHGPRRMFAVIDAALDDAPFDLGEVG